MTPLPSNSRPRNRRMPMAEINVTPMVDVMLVLLIIFMVAAPLMVQGVPVELPKTSATKLGQVKKPMVVTLSGDGNLYIRYADGMMTLVKAQPTGFEEVGKFKIPSSGSRPSWSHPVVVDGKLYLREGDKILCYNVRG